MTTDAGSAGAGRDGSRLRLLESARENLNWAKHSITGPAEDRLIDDAIEDVINYLLAVPDPLASDTGHGENEMSQEQLVGLVQRSTSNGSVYIGGVLFSEKQSQRIMTDLLELIPHVDQRDVFIAAIRTLRESCRVNAGHDAGGSKYRQCQRVFMEQLDETLRIIDNAAPLASSSEPQGGTPRQIVKAAFVEGFCAGVARPEMGTESAWQESQAVCDSVDRSASSLPVRASGAQVADIQDDTIQACADYIEANYGDEGGEYSQAISTQAWGPIIKPAPSSASASSLPVRASGEPQKEKLREIVKRMRSHGTAGQRIVKRWADEIEDATFPLASASPSDDGAAQPQPNPPSDIQQKIATSILPVVETSRAARQGETSGGTEQDPQ